MKHIQLIDSTFREGKQSSLNRLLVGKAEKYSHLIDKMGIEYMEVNHPYTSAGFLQEYRKLANLKKKVVVFTHSAANDEDLNLLLKEGVKNISTFFVGRNKVVLVNKIKRVLDWASRNDLKIRVNIENSFSLNRGVVCAVLKLITNHPALSHFCLADSNGSATPKTVCSLFRYIDSSIPKPIPIEFHLHNDQGLAAANFYALYRLNKELKRNILFTISLSGMGERNGILSYGDVLAVLRVSEGKAFKKRYDISLYKNIFDLVFSDNELFNRDPINPRAFSHVAKSHIKDVIKKNKFQTIDPQEYGFEVGFEIGELFGTNALIEISKKYFNLTIPYKIAKKLSSNIRNSFSETKKNLTLTELQTIVRSNIKK